MLRSYENLQNFLEWPPGTDATILLNIFAEKFSTKLAGFLLKTKQRYGKFW
jgi:hypothetical protein